MGSRNSAVSRSRNLVPQHWQKNLDWVFSWVQHSRTLEEQLVSTGPVGHAAFGRAGVEVNLGLLPSNLGTSGWSYSKLRVVLYLNSRVTKKLEMSRMRSS